VSALADKRTWLFCLALLCVLGTFAIPRLPVHRPIYDVLAVLDITGSMNTRDQFLAAVPISRIELEKRAVQELLAALPCGSRLGVAIFVESRPFVLFEPVEICGNFAPLQASVAGIAWRMGWDSESHIAEGLHAALLSARDLGADLIFLTDGQEVPPMAWSTPPDFASIRGAAHGLVMGVGGRDFVPIPKFDREGREIGVWKPGEVPSETGGIFKGHEYLTAVDEPHLRELAAQAALTYRHLDAPTDLLQALRSAVPPRILKTTMDARFIPGGLALLLVAACFLKR